MIDNKINVYSTILKKPDRPSFLEPLAMTQYGFTTCYDGDKAEVE